MLPSKDRSGEQRKTSARQRKSSVIALTPSPSSHRFDGFAAGVGAGFGFAGAGWATRAVENTGAFLSAAPRTAALVAAALTVAAGATGAASALLYALARISRSSKSTVPSPLKSPWSKVLPVPL